MNIERLASGAYRARITYKGKTYRITYPNKPTQRQAEHDLHELISQNPDFPNGELSFKATAEKYIEMKRNVLSPGTLREYSRTCQRLAPWFVKLPIKEITQLEINKQVNELALKLSPKTVRNYHGVISAILGTFNPSLRICTTLPQKHKIEPYIPSDDEVKKVLEASKGTDFYIAFVLACYGLRRGEICALTADDIEGQTVHVNKALAQNDNNEFVVKATKTTDSERDVLIPLEIAQLIKAQGYVYKGHPNSITKHLARTEKALGLPHFPLHKLRHYFASKMLTLTDSKTVQALGGWKTDSVLRNIYAHSLKEEQEKAKKAAVEQLKDVIF